MRVLIHFLFSLFLCSCDLSEFKFPEVSKDEGNDKSIEDTEVSNKSEFQKHANTSGNIITVNKQDPSKDFNEVSHSITRGRAIHPFPAD